MLAGNTNKRRVLKHGWVYKRGNHGFSNYKLKWLVLQEQGQGHITLNIFDQRDQAAQNCRPKYVIDPANITIEIPHDVIPKRMGLFSSKIRLAPFVLATRDRRFHLSAQCKKDRDDWINAIQEFNNGPIARHAYNYEDDDTFSVFSDAISTLSVSRRTVAASNIADNDSVYTHTTAGLSFGNASVLSPQELQQIGRATNQKTEVGRRKSLASMSRHKMQSQTDLSANGKWNEIYQKALVPTDGNSNSFERDIKICETVGSFKELAEFYGRKIIDEIHSKSTTKAVGPLDSAISNPNTWLFGDIYFHFAAEYEEDDLEEIESSLMKTSHELRSINAVNHSDSGLHTALMSLVDYKGFRLVAYALMPLDEYTTIVLDVLGEEPRIDEVALMKVNDVGSKLNLKEHGMITHYDRRIRISAASTVEVHRCPRTQEYYALNLCDIYPSDHPAGKDFNLLDPLHRLRPEFVRHYKTSLSSDAFTSHAASRKEKEQCDNEVMYAAKYLREHTIPQFVRKLDELEILPIDSKEFTERLHSHGINVRHIGLITKLTKLPCIRDLCYIEMVSRSCKILFRTKLRRAVFHFRSVEATKIEEELKSYVVTMFQTVLGNDGPQTKKFWSERLRETVRKKFDFDLDFQDYIGIHRPAIFLSMQYHCGVKFEDGIHYNFDSDQAVRKELFTEFITKIKAVDGLCQGGLEGLNEEERHTYTLARHLASLGPKSKLCRNDETARILSSLSQYYNSNGRYQDAHFYLTAALNLASRNHAGTALIYMNLMENHFLAKKADGPDHIVMDYYNHALSMVEFHWGPNHPLVANLHETMAKIHAKANLADMALEYYIKSLEIVRKTLGNSHLVSAKHLTQIGNILMRLTNYDQAIQRYSESLEILQSLTDVDEFIAEDHFSIANCLYSKGDYDAGLRHSHDARKIREKDLGQMHARTIESYRQFAKLVLANYENYDGVVTPHIRKCYQSAIQCYERIFKFVKSKRERNSTTETLDLTRTIVSLKFRLLPREHQEILKSARQAHTQHPEQAVKEVILRLVHLTPTVYVDDLFARNIDGDEDAMMELEIVTQLVENDSLALM